MSSATEAAATIDDLYRVEGKAELIDGRIVHLMATGFQPNQVAGEIFVSLKVHARTTGQGVAFTDNMGFAVLKLTSGRQSFSPDASYYDGPRPRNTMRFVDGPPTFAVEVRSENDYGNAAEQTMVAKRADYFEAGTKVVWDVDCLNEVVRKFTTESGDQPVVFGLGQQADAEPAVPGWRMAVDGIFA